jgi:hypothetical protein
MISKETRFFSFLVLFLVAISGTALILGAWTGDQEEIEHYYPS